MINSIVFFFWQGVDLIAGGKSKRPKGQLLSPTMST
uniref:Uncharacterized protein n=1 Tax=Brassica oleracea TaxID=3712 RepID=A0A3P6EQP6_BRAOL|nr:unnamed protein product [Brassica oleracea]